MAVKFEPEKKPAEPEKAAPAKADPKADPKAEQAKVATKAEPKATAKPESKAEPEVVTRAGGYVDKGDGAGWVIEEDEA